MRVRFPAPAGKQFLPGLPTPSPVPHAMLHDDGRFEAAIPGRINHPFNAFGDRMSNGEIVWFRHRHP
jgi:hypothetical protein